MAQKKFMFDQSILVTVLSNPDTELKEIMLEGVYLLEAAPEILEKIGKDIDRNAKHKKSMRLEDQRWYRRLTDDLPGMSEIKEIQKPEEEHELRVGRPRKLDAEAVYFLLLIRSHWDSVTSKATVDRLLDSRLVNDYFESRGMKLASSHTMLDYLNVVSQETREYIFTRQWMRIVGEG